MSKYAAVNVKFGADISGFSTAMQNAARQMQNAGQQLQDVGKSMTMNLTAPIAALGAASLYAFGQIDALKRGLISISGSAAAAETEFTKLRDVAKLPGIGLEEAVKGSINLQAIGMSADDARNAMMAFGNAIATVGGGRENFDLAIRGFGQLQNAAKPLQQDLYQIANQLPQVNKLMIEAFGTNRAEELAAKGITGKQLAEFLVKALSELPKVAGGIKNAFENMGDSVSNALAGFGKAIDESFDISGKLNAFAEWIEKVANGFQNLQPWVQKTILVIVGLVAAIGPLLLIIGGIVQIMPMVIAGFAAIKGAIAAVMAVSAPAILSFLAIVAAIAALIAAGSYLYANWGAITDRMSNLFIKLKTAILKELQELAKGLNSFFSFFGSNAFTGVETVFNTLVDNIPKEQDARDFMSFGESMTKTWSDIKANLMKPITVGEITTDENGKPTDKPKGTGTAPKQFDIIEMDSKGITEQFDQTAIAVGKGWDKINQAEQVGGQKFIGDRNKLWTKSMQDFKNLIMQLDAMANDFIAGTITSIAVKMGEALGGAKDPFKDWGNFLLDSLGQFMQQMGSLFIAFGINLALFKDSLKSMNPYLAIAAGVALVAVGAAISQTSKAGLEGARSGGSSGSVSTSSSSSDDMVLYSRLDGKDLVLSGQRTSAIGRR